MKHLQNVFINIHNTGSDSVFRDCTQGKEYKGQYVAVGERDAHGVMTSSAHAPCYQFKDDVGDWVVVAYADKYLDVTVEAEAKADAPEPTEPVDEANPNGIPCVIVWNESGTCDLTQGKEYPGFIVTDNVKRLLDGVPYFPNGTLYVQMFDDVNDPTVRRYEAGRFSFK